MRAEEGYMQRTSIAACAAACTIACLSAGAVQAQTAFPAKAVYFVTPFPPGGSLDPLTRMSAQKLGEFWKRPTIVENRPGGNSIIGTQTVARAAPDGYTLLVAGTPHVINPSLFATPYDAIKDFAPIATIARSRQILVVNRAMPVTSVKEIVALARARPGELNYGSSGTGNTNHLAGELFSTLAGIRMTHVPYKGAGPALTDLIGGQLHLSFHVPISALPHVRSGRLKALATTGQARITAAPDIPTFAEAGMPGFDLQGWTGMFAPAGTSKAIVDRISADMARVLTSPDIVERLTNMGQEPFVSTPEEFAALLQSELVRYAKIIKDAGIKVEL
jgi:tripartite-type tricarboxylate transporter receptor subunit TctC